MIRHDQAIAALRPGLMLVRYRGVQFSGKQFTACREIRRSPIAQRLTDCLEFVRRANQSFEAALEVLRHVEPITWVNLQSLQHWWHNGRNCPSLIFSQYPAGPVHQLQVIGKAKGKDLWVFPLWDFPQRAGERLAVMLGSLR